MTPLYNAGIHLYRAAARIAAMRSRKVATMIGGQRETLERLRAERKRIAPEGYDLWVHAASLGEFEQGDPPMKTSPPGALPPRTSRGAHSPLVLLALGL